MKTPFLMLSGLGLLLVLLAGCASDAGKQEAAATPEMPEAPVTPKVYPSIGRIERLDPRFDSLISRDARIETLAKGFKWAEGPVWVGENDYLLFSDVPNNVVFKWKEGQGTTEFLYPSGYTGSRERTGGIGSNGLLLDANGQLVLCQHGDRQVSRLEEDGSFAALAEYYNFYRFNSPNDAVYRSNGDLYFTDPPYGLEQGNNDPKKELLVNGVYRRKTNGEINLLITDLTFPNGIAFSIDEKTLYVAVSDPERPVIMAYDVLSDGLVANGRVFFDATPLKETGKGLPDGLKLDAQGNLFATGPGGVLVLTPQGEHLGTIRPEEVATANCAWGNDGSMLYLTSHNYLLRIQTTTRGQGFPQPEASN